MLRDYYGFAASRVCLVPRCGRPAELHHLAGGVSLATGLPLPRRKGAARALVVPLCPIHHRTGPAALHTVGEAAFEPANGLPQGYLMRLAASLLAAYITTDGGGS